MDALSRNTAAETIENLIESVKSDSDDNSYLIDVLSLAQKAVQSAQVLAPEDTPSIFEELGQITNKIKETKSGLDQLPSYNQNRVPQAGKELDEIVKATEGATNSIMEQAEAILAADPSDMDKYQEEVTGAVMQIFEACSFQDITGQRIAKVVKTLQYIDERITAIAENIGLDMNCDDTENETDEDKRARELLLNGPSTGDEGINQNDVDNLLNEDSASGSSDQSDIDALFD